MPAPVAVLGNSEGGAHRRRRDAWVVEIRAIRAAVTARYGSPRIHAELAVRGQDCCVNTVATHAATALL